MNYNDYLILFELLEKEAFDKLEAMEREAQRAELEGLSVCGDDEWGRR